MSAQQERWECPSCGAPLNIASLGIFAKVACPRCGHVDHVHDTLANFRIEGVLGLGGMSVVLRAHDLVLDRPLAIKLLNEFYRDQQERIKRFEHECELMAKVRHENVVSVYSAGWEKGQFYIAMELIHGRNLEEMVHEGDAMAPEKALDIVRQIALGLDAAHRAGLLHRDMKPGNIIICDDGKAKVLDFGLSLGTQAEDTEEVIWATPFYVPPETLMREAEDLRTDIYALGMTLRHMLTQKENFDSEPHTIKEMLACKRELPRMADAMPELDEAYCELVDHMTAYAPEDRPGSYASLLVEIDEVRHALSAAGREVRAADRRRRWSMSLAGAAATLVFGSAAAMLTSVLAKPAPVQQYITPSGHLDWYESDTLTQAMWQLKKGDMKEACSLMAALANSEGEAAACAWASLHAALFSDMQDGFVDDAGSQPFRERFRYHLSRTPESAGRELHAAMQSMLAPRGGASEHKPLQALMLVDKLQKSILSCQDAAVPGLIKECQTALAEAGAPYDSLRKLLPKAQEALKNTRTERVDRLYAERYAHAVSCLDTAEASRILGLKAGISAAGRGRARLDVQQEALALFSEAVEMLRRHSLAPEAGISVSVEELQSIASRLEEPALPVELRTLMLMAQGNFTDAAALKPYGSDADSAETFAIIMRDWLKRVK